MRQTTGMREPRLLGFLRLVISQIDIRIRGIRDRVKNLVKLAFSRYQRVRHFGYGFYRYVGIRSGHTLKMTLFLSGEGQLTASGILASRMSRPILMYEFYIN